MDSSYLSVTGTVTAIEMMNTSSNDWCGCSMLITILSPSHGTANLVIAPYTHILEQEPIAVGDTITAFYSATAPMPLIYPPQYRVMAVAKDIAGRNVVLDTFDASLVSGSGLLKLTPDASTRVILSNGQPYSGSLEGRTMLAVYGASTRSIPAIATPSLLVVFCCQK